MGLNLINASNGSGEAVRASVTGIRASGATTLAVDAITNWPPYFIATAGSLLSDGTLDPSTALVFAGHIGTSNIIIDDIAPGYTDNGNSVGDVVLIKPATMWADNIADTLAVSHNDDGTLNTDAIDDVATGLDGKQVRLKMRVLADTTQTTLTPDIDSYNVYELSAQATALTIANPTGTPNDGDVLVLRIKDSGTSRAITYGTDFTNISGLDSLTATTANKWHVIGAMYNEAVTKWQILSITTEA